MIIGNGMLAKLFVPYQCRTDIIILASGVSNSKEMSQYEFERELSLVHNYISAHKDKIIVYFSTSSMYDSLSKGSPYVLHKLAMEDYIIKNANYYYIFRISQIIGIAHNQTLVNFLIRHILENREFEVWSKSTRNLIAIHDVFSIIDYILQQQLYLNSIINVANKHNILMTDLIPIVERAINKKAKCKFISKGCHFERIDISKIMHICDKLGINFDSDDYYLSSIIEIFKEGYLINKG